MSLIKQLWLSIITMMLLAFGGSFFITLIFSKHYLEEQLQTKNMDNATSLALSISNMEKDPVAIGLLVAAQFDSGHYAYIRLTDPQGRVLSERSRSSNGAKVPAWFVRLVPFKIRPGIAQVQNGWSQFGTLTLVTDTRFAHEALWRGCLMMLSWILALAILGGIIGTLILRVVTRPLRDVVSLATAIGDRRFITIEEPRIEEFKAVAHAMNLLSARIKKMLDEETQRLEQLRLEINYDQVSGLMNRNYFNNRAEGMLNNPEKFTEGALIVIKLQNLSELDRHLGHDQTNLLIKRLGDALNGLAVSQPSLFAGRLKGTDFAVFSESPTDSYTLASQIKGLLIKAASLPTSAPELDLAIIASRLKVGDHLEQKQHLIASLMLEMATLPNTLHVITEEQASAHLDRDEEQWRVALTDAIKAKRVKLGAFPVLSPSGDLIHFESPVRMAFGHSKEWVNAGQFLAWATHFDMMGDIDNLVLECAFDELRAGHGPIGLNISGRAIGDRGFINRLKKTLRDNQSLATELWLEVPEQDVFDNLPEFRAFCEILQPAGCKVGIEHAGNHITRFGELHDLGIDYIKIDVSVIHNIHLNPGNQAFLRGLSLIAHTMGMVAIAEGVRSPEERSILPELGIDAMTGPAITS